MEFSPWPEHPPPAGQAADCTAFGLAGHGRFVWGEGNPEAERVFVLDNPGAREDKDGTPFVCGTRRTLRRAAAEAGIDVDDVYVTYLVKCRPRRAYDKPAARRHGRAVLEEQLQGMPARVLVLLGDVVVQTLFDGGEDGTRPSVRALRGEELHLFGRTAFATYHPLAARRRPNLYPFVVEDLRRVIGYGVGSA